MTSINNYYGQNATNYVNTLFGTNNKTSSYSANIDDLYSTLLSQYGKNTATGLSSNLQNYLSTIKTSSASLKSLTEETLGRTAKNTLYNQKTIASSDSDVVSVASKSYSATELNSLKDTSVTVEQIAKAQVNEGSALSKNTLSLGTGSKSMTITDSNGKNYSFAVNPNMTQTNEKVQNQLADKINSANIGVTAKVEIDGKNNTSKLVLTSNNTGEKSAFSVSGNLAEALGVSEASTKAQNAVYTVDGTTKTSQGNSVEVSGISMTLKKASSEAIKFTEKNDNSNLINTTREMVNQFNKMMSAAEDNIKDRGAEKLYNSMTSLLKTYQSSLSKAGITINDSGYLEIDEDKMGKAAESGALQQLVGKDSGNANYGFASRLQQLATKVTNNPTNYLSTDAKYTAEKSMDVSANYRSSMAAANFSTKLNSYYNTGLLFESMF